MKSFVIMYACLEEYLYWNLCVCMSVPYPHETLWWGIWDTVKRSYDKSID